MFALAAFYGSTSTIGILPLLDESKVPLVGTISGASKLFDPGSKYLFNVRASYWQETHHIVRQLAILSMKRIAVVYQDDAFGQDGLEGVKRAVDGAKMSIVATATIARNQDNATDAVKVIAASKPDAVVIVLLHKPAVSFIKGVHEASVYPSLLPCPPSPPTRWQRSSGSSRVAWPSTRSCRIRRTMRSRWCGNIAS